MSKSISKSKSKSNPISKPKSKKQPISERKRLANQRNAQKSTGP